jgi:four helix bundle protein
LTLPAQSDNFGTSVEAGKRESVEAGQAGKREKINQQANKWRGGVKITSYRDLFVYQKSFELCIKVYKCTEGFPKSELYGLTGQMRRAAVSIPSNIAEGHQRRGRKEFLQFLSVARGSCAELETQISISITLGYISDEKGNALLNEAYNVSGLIYKTMQSLKA